MEKYISLAALIAEIERRIKKYAAIDTVNSVELDALYGAKCKALMEILSFLDTIELKEIADEKTKWSPSKKQMESLKDMLKYNIGVFDYQKFMEVNSLYDDLKKLMDD